MGDKKDKGGEANKVFCDNYSNGLQTNRDAWCYGFSIISVRQNMSQTTNYYNQQRELLASGVTKVPEMDSTRIKFCSNVLMDIKKNKIFEYADNRIVDSIYRPFVKSNLYYCSNWNHRTGQMPSIYPFSIMRQSPNASVNRMICVEGAGGSKDFSCFMTDCVTSKQTASSTQCFPLHVHNTEEKLTKQLKQRSMFGGGATKPRRFYNSIQPHVGHHGLDSRPDAQAVC